MKRIKDHDEQLGYFTFVQNNETTDYLKLAYACGLSLKATQGINKFAIAVDEATKECLEDKHYKVFDYVVDIPWGDESKEDSWKLGNEWKAWAITPFKETVKIDCDLVFTRNIDHWWTFMREQEVLIATNVRKLDGSIATSRKYRKVFDENELPNAYSGFMYFRYGEESLKLFKTLKWVYKNWNTVTENIKNCRDSKPTTDVALAIALVLQEQEYTATNSVLDYPTFVHLKPSILEWPEQHKIEDVVNISYSDSVGLLIGVEPQLYPVHGAECKEYLADKTIEYYERT